MMTEATRAELVLALVLESLSTWEHTEFRTEVQKSWTEGDSVVCLVYRQTGMYSKLTLGLRRTVEDDWSIEGLVEEMVVCEMGEPLGSLYESLQPDAKGVMWWTGNLPEWKERR
jgi:hypothetical protein